MQTHFLIVEDDIDAGEFLRDTLVARGFRATHVSSAEDADAFMTEEEAPPTVAVLDLNLEGSNRSGAQVGKRLQQLYRDAPPELIFYSAYSDQQFWEAAVRMSVAAYLNKSSDGFKAVVTHVRVLAMRYHIVHHLHTHQPQFRELVRTRVPESQIYVGMLETMFCPLFEQHLGCPFFFLLRFEGEVFCVNGDALDLPGQASIYEKTQDHMRDLVPGEFAYGHDINGVTSQQGALASIGGTALVTLYDNRRIQLTVGIVNNDPPPGSKQEKGENLAEALCSHLRYVWLDRTFSLVEMLIKEEDRRRESLNVTARFCKVFGHLQSEMVAMAVARDELAEDSYVLPGLQNVGQHMMDIGNQLGIIDSTTPAMVTVNLSEQAEDVWSEMARQLRLTHVTFTCSSNIEVLANRDDLRATLRRIFGWIGNRYLDNPELAKPVIDISIKPQHERWCQVIISGNSKRLPPAILTELFKPFSDALDFDDGLDEWVGLFMARMLTEIRLGGHLTEEGSSKEAGHRFTLELQTPRLNASQPPLKGVSNVSQTLH